MRTEIIQADTIDKAAEKILKALKEKPDTTRTVSSRDNVFYFNGFDGLGASAVLRVIAQRLSTTSSADGKRALALAGLEFDQVIHIDCSTWESRRALQRAVAEQLKLPSEVMQLFDRQDEEDDFHGVAQGSRTELQDVLREIYRHTQNLNRRFLVIFHNGSSEEIDLASFCGFLLSGYSTSKVLWTFQGRFGVKPWKKLKKAMKMAGTTDVSFRLYPRNKRPEELWLNLVLEEAAELVAACKVNTGHQRNIIVQPTQVADCFLHMMLLLCAWGRLSSDCDLDTHAANYWVCDGMIRHLQQGEGDIIGGDDDDLWRAACALQREMMFSEDYQEFMFREDYQEFLLRYLNEYSLLRYLNEYLTSQSLTCGFTLITDGAFPNEDSFNRFRVLKLSGSTFDFQSPPFLCCHSLRFLWLDHCQSTRTSTDAAAKEEDVRQCFERLWVLDVRHTDCDQILSAQMLDFMTQLKELNVMGARGWNMDQLQGRLPNIRKLRVKNSIVTCSCSENDLFLEMSKMEHLDFSGNETGSMTHFFGPGVSSNASSLETVVMVDACDGLEQISFSGCTELKNILLGGQMRIRTLDISGTAVKTLDLSTTTIPYLDELYLLDCKKLCAILWPPKEQMKQEGLGRLCIDTTGQSALTAQSREEKATRGTSTATTGTALAPVSVAAAHGSWTSSEFDWHMSLWDARLLVSFEKVYFDSRNAYVEVSSPPCATIAAGGSKGNKGIKSGSSCELQVPAVYPDSTVDHLRQDSRGNWDTPVMLWTCPNAPDLPEKSYYMHIQDQTGIKLLSGGEGTRTITVPEFVVNCAKILHVHDSLSMTIFPSGTKYLGSEWHNVEWCRIERCPRLDCVFTPGEKSGGGFVYMLRTFWASQLLKARYIWKKSEPSGFYRTFPDLAFLHLDCSPLLIHVLPLSRVTFEPNTFTLKFGHNLSQLETLEITWCENLREVFPLDTKAKEYVEQQPQPVTLCFPSLKHIHLHELPKLERICGVRMSAPNLETVKIKGCWSLTCLPDVSGSNKIVECNCEKEWWDRLVWDDSSQACHYKPTHSLYYKKTMLRRTVLR